MNGEIWELLLTFSADLGSNIGLDRSSYPPVSIKYHRFPLCWFIFNLNVYALLLNIPFCFQYASKHCTASFLMKPWQPAILSRTYMRSVTRFLYSQIHNGYIDLPPSVATNCLVWIKLKIKNNPKINFRKKLLMINLFVEWYANLSSSSFLFSVCNHHVNKHSGLHSCHWWHKTINTLILFYQVKATCMLHNVAL